MAVCEQGRRDCLAAGDKKDARTCARIYGELYQEERAIVDALGIE